MGEAPDLRSSRSGPRDAAVRVERTQRDEFMSLTSQVEGGLRDAYAERFDADLFNLDTLSLCLNVTRHTIKRRFNGQTDMRLSAVADMAWAMGLRTVVTFVEADLQDRSEMAQPEATPTSPRQTG